MKYSGFFRCALAVAIYFGFSGTSFANVELLGHWIGNNTTLDSSGNGHDGTLVGGATFASDAFSFGTSGAAFVVPHDEVFNFGTGDFSYSLQFKVPSSGFVDQTGLISKDDYFSGAPNYKGWMANNCSGCGGVGAEIRDMPTYVHSRTSSYTFSEVNWYTLTVVRESNVNYTYLDGILVKSATELTPIDVSNSADITIGALNYPSTLQTFGGLIRDVAIFKGALTSGQVSNIARAGVSAVPEPASWVLMIGGMALTGAALRRQAVRFSIA